MDLSIIAGLQIACLLAGMWTVYQTRPVAVVYADGAFRSFPYQYFKDANVDITQQPLLSAKWPVWVYVEGHETAKPMGAINDVIFMQIENYQLIDKEFSERIKPYGKTVEQLPWVPQLAGLLLLEGEALYPAGFGIGSGWLQWRQMDDTAVNFIGEGTRQTAFDRLRKLGK